MRQNLAVSIEVVLNVDGGDDDDCQCDLDHTDHMNLTSVTPENDDVQEGVGAEVP